MATASLPQAICYEVLSEKIITEWTDPDGSQKPAIIALDFREIDSNDRIQLLDSIKMSKIYFNNDRFRRDISSNRPAFDQSEVRYVAPTRDRVAETIRSPNDNTNNTTSLLSRLFRRNRTSSNPLHQIKGLMHYPSRANIDFVHFNANDLRFLCAHFNKLVFSGTKVSFGNHHSDVTDRDTLTQDEYFAMKVEGIEPNRALQELLDSIENTGDETVACPGIREILHDMPSCYLGPTCPPKWYITQMATRVLFERSAIESLKKPLNPCGEIFKSWRLATTTRRAQ